MRELSSTEDEYVDRPTQNRIKPGDEGFRISPITRGRHKARFNGLFNYTGE
jgi:hypothetical protein